MKQLAEKFDALDEGRRRLIYIASLVLLAVVAHIAFIEPLISEQKALLFKLAQTDSQLKSARARTEALLNTSLADPDLENKKRLAELRSRLADDTTRLRVMQQKLITPEKMSDLL
ncbi:MAG TPA: hypothetical protein PLK99_09165, partial [Burkholderiales bacterium]|nr:hypothetical protein [Burkholderiales bacterium]